MAYTKTTWQNLPNTTTPITAANLNNIEDGIETLDNAQITVNNSYNTSTTDTYSCNYVNNLEPIVLYNNSTGSTSSITLNDSYTNYKYIEIWGKRSNRYGYTKLDTSVSNSISLIVAGPSTSNITFYNAVCVFNDKTLSLSGNAIAISSSAIVGFSVSNEVAIVKVIGYK